MHFVFLIMTWHQGNFGEVGLVVLNRLTSLSSDSMDSIIIFTIFYEKTKQLRRNFSSTS